MFKIIGATVVYGLALFGLAKALEARASKQEPVSSGGGTAG